MNKSAKKNRSFAFLVHPRHINDLYEKYYYLKIIPKSLLLALLRFMPPIYVAKITGAKSKDNTTCLGHIISIPLTSEQILEDRQLAKKQTIKAIQKAKKIGASHVGLGAFTSVVTSGGTDVKDLFPDVHITNGNALTAHITYTDLTKIINSFQKKPTIALIGATGSVGVAVAELLANDKNCKKIIIVGRTQSKIKQLYEKLVSIVTDNQIVHAKISNALPQADIIVSMTSASGAVIIPDLLKEDAIIYDITQPKNIPADIFTYKPNVTIYDGALVKLPDSIKIKYNIKLPAGVAYACLAETILLSLAHYPDNFSVGNVSLDNVMYTKKLAEEYGFISASFIQWKNK
jgi:predicted amino acid dehydrogenase